MVDSLNRRLGLSQGSQVSAAVSQRHPFSKLKELRWAVITEKCTRPARTLGYREFWVTLIFHFSFSLASEFILLSLGTAGDCCPMPLFVEGKL